MANGSQRLRLVAACALDADHVAASHRVAIPKEFERVRTMPEFDGRPHGLHQGGAAAPRHSCRVTRARVSVMRCLTCISSNP